MSSVAEQIQEYESQLLDVQALLEASPGDPALVSLQSDLIELLSLTRPQQLITAASMPTTRIETTTTSEQIMTSVSVFDKELAVAVGKSIGRDDEETFQVGDEQPISFADTMQEAAIEADQSVIPRTIDTGREPPKKKSKTIKEEFEVPQHLIGLETDTDAERNKKQRALKALKSKWRESKKEIESANKQKSWQSFQKKNKVKSSSMFKTGDAAVGVVSAAGRQLTDFAERKRHKHEQA
jgi:survival of motor neuron-related-splicing factor 30